MADGETSESTGAEETTSTSRTIVNVYDMQHYLSFDDGTTNIRVTEDTSFEADRETEEYTTAYLDRKEQTTYVVSQTDTISFEIDAVGPDGIQKYLMQYEDTANVPVVYTRTIGYDFANGQACASTALVAKQAPAILNVKPLKGGAGEPLKITGEISVTGAYTHGTFNESTGAFTAASSGTNSQSG